MAHGDTHELAHELKHVQRSLGQVGGVGQERVRVSSVLCEIGTPHEQVEVVGKQILLTCHHTHTREHCHTCTGRSNER